MARQSLNWNSFWDLATPEQAAQVLVEFYGVDAALAAAYCGLAAYADDRDDDYRYWFTVFRTLHIVEWPPATLH